jgi:CheY-like chemotaxis protein
MQPDVVKPQRSIVGYEGERRKLLVVDDNADNRQLLVDLLGPLQFVVVTAEDGQQAIDRACGEKPDAILLDMVVPVKSGFVVAQEVRQQAELESTQVIAVSASVAESDREKAYAAGCDGFLPKPVNSQDLFDLLAAKLDLTWIYAEDAAPVDEPLVAPPAEELRALQQLLEQGQIFEIRDRAKELEAQDNAYAPFARQLKNLSESMDIAQIEVLIERYLGE